MRELFTVLVVLCLLAAGAAGCGGDDGDDDSGGLGSRAEDERQIREKGAAYEAAFEAKDAEGLCELLAPSSIEESGGFEACVKEFSAKTSIINTADETDMRVVGVTFDEEDPNAATANLKNKGFQFYLFEDGEWHPSLFTD